jgi:hypothetical protein
VTDSVQVHGRETAELIAVDSGHKVGDIIVVLILLHSLTILRLLLSILHLLLSTLCLMSALCLLIILRLAGLAVSEAFATGT